MLKKVALKEIVNNFFNNFFDNFNIFPPMDGQQEYRAPQDSQAGRYRHLKEEISFLNSFDRRQVSSDKIENRNRNIQVQEKERGLMAGPDAVRILVIVHEKITEANKYSFNHAKLAIDIHLDTKENFESDMMRLRHMFVDAARIHCPYLAESLIQGNLHGKTAARAPSP